MNGTPVTGTPAAGTSVTGTPGTGTPVAGTSVIGTPVIGTSVTGTSVTGTPVTGTPVTGTPVTGTPVTGTPVTGVPSRAATVARLRAAGCVFAEDEAVLLESEAATGGELERMLRLRIAGLPLEQVLGWAAFGGLRVVVEPGVFVPRRRTELLAEIAVGAAHPGDVVVDLCCGSGAVGAVVAAAVEVELYAADVDPVAVHCARRNLPSATVLEGDLFDALPPALRGRVAVLAVNAPYVPTDAIDLMPPEAREHEPASALDGGADGLEFHRRVADAASEWLAAGGRVLIETSRTQAAGTEGLLAARGFATTVDHDPDRDATVVTGRLG